MRLAFGYQKYRQLKLLLVLGGVMLLIFCGIFLFSTRPAGPDLKTLPVTVQISKDRQHTIDFDLDTSPKKTVRQEIISLKKRSFTRTYKTATKPPTRKLKPTKTK